MKPRLVAGVTFSHCSKLKPWARAAWELSRWTVWRARARLFIKELAGWVASAAGARGRARSGRRTAGAASRRAAGTAAPRVGAAARHGRRKLWQPTDDGVEDVVVAEPGEARGAAATRTPPEDLVNFPLEAGPRLCPPGGRFPRRSMPRVPSQIPRLSPWQPRRTVCGVPLGWEPTSDKGAVAENAQRRHLLYQMVHRHRV